MICQNCAAENSIYAAICYHYGFPLGGKPRKKRYKLVVGMMFVVLVGILILGFPQIRPKTDEWVVKGKRAYFTFIDEQNFSLNKFSEAVAFYSKAINLGGSSARLLAQRGYAYYQLREYGHAREDCSRAIEMATQVGKCRLSREKTYLMLKQKAAAREDLTVAAKAGNLEAEILLLSMAGDDAK